MTHFKDTLETAKERIDIPRAWQILNFSGSPSNSCSSPFRDDRSPSFSIFDDGRAFKDHATDEGGDVVTFVQAATGMDFKDTANWLFSHAGLPVTHVTPSFNPPRLSSCRKAPVKPPEVAPESLKFPALHQASNEELAAVADSRRIHWQAALVASQLGTLRFGKVCGFDCWLLVDDSGRIAESRRVDGKPFPAYRTLGERKAHTIKGSQKSWPMGLGSEHLLPDDNILMVEGGPDFLAAIHFRFARRRDSTNSGKGWFPIAMLGRSNSIHPDALPLFKGRRVRIYPHADTDGGGMTAAKRWAQSVYEAGACEIDFFSFDGIQMKDGSPASDLNDCTTCHADSIIELINIFPTLPPDTSCP